MSIPKASDPSQKLRALLFSSLILWSGMGGRLGMAEERPLRPRIIVAFGDSTTAARQVEGTPLPVYVDLLAAAAKPWGVRFINAGVPGNTTSNAMARFAQDVLAQSPDVVILQFGINDAAVDVWREPPATEPRVAVTAYASNLTYFVTAARAAGARVVLMTPNPIRWTAKLRELYGKPPYQLENPEGFSVVLKHYAQAVRDVATQTGAPLADVDAAFEKFGTEKNQSVDALLLDGMHPNAVGHEIIARLVREVLPRQLGLAVCPANTFKSVSSGMEIDVRATDLPGFKPGPFVLLRDGGWLTMEETNCLTSADQGQTWKASPIFAGARDFILSREQAILRTREGVVIVAGMNMAAKHWTWDDQLGDAPGAILPTCVLRSTDEGATWLPPQRLHEDWTGAIREMIQTKSGRVIFTSMIMQHNPGRHTVLTYCSDDQGLSWRPSNVIDLGGAGHHDGVTEATIVELKDGRLRMLLRTNWGRFWLAESMDVGLHWQVLGPSDIAASAAPALLRRLRSGRVVMVWNRPWPEGKDSFPLTGGDRRWSAVPASVFRGELAIAFSDDDCRSWTAPVILARQSGEKSWLSYPYLFEPSAGELWITTMQGGVRVRVQETDFVLNQN